MRVPRGRTARDIAARAVVLGGKNMPESTSSIRIPSSPKRVLSDSFSLPTGPPSSPGGLPDSTERSALRKASYPWDSNSCWLDTSLQLLYTSFNRNFPQFSLVFQSLSDESGLRALFDAMYTRRFLDLKELASSSHLRQQRDDMRLFLGRLGVIQGVDVCESLYVWLMELVRREPIEKSYRAASFFEVLTVEVHSCSGSAQTGGRHVEITSRPIRRRIHELSKVDHEKFNGSFSKYFVNMTSLGRDPVSRQNCWRVQENRSYCSGKRSDFTNLVLSLPILFVVEVAEDSMTTGGDALLWDFPDHVSPDGLSNEPNCVYDLVGLALVNTSGSHFIARYAEQEHIYNYDDQKNDGCAVLDSDARSEGGLTGNWTKPDNYQVYTAFYHLRGGVEAQDCFFENRTSFYGKRYDLQFSECNLGRLSYVTYASPDFRMLNEQELSWTTSEGRTEYVSICPVEDNDHNDVLTLIPISPLPRNPIVPDISFEDGPTYVIRCRCGLEGDGNFLYRMENGIGVGCSFCGARSHIACQIPGRVLEIDGSYEYTCDTCSARPLVSTTSEQKKSTGSKGLIQPGRGALVRLGNFWYPVRLIQALWNNLWLVRLWRGCHLTFPGVHPGEFFRVHKRDLLDTLIFDHATRRKIRLGKWELACQSPDISKGLADPACTPYTKEVSTALAPFTSLLSELVHGADHIQRPYIPAKDWMEAGGLDMFHSPMHFTGGLSVMDRAQINSWFEAHVGQEKRNRQKWVNKLPIVHAYTLFIAYRLGIGEATSKFRGARANDILQKAWEIQLAGSPIQNFAVDVEKHCIELLENEMFMSISEFTQPSARADSDLWGVDVGGNQDGWDPYSVFAKPQ